jgi:hypothetical protein
MRTLASGGSEGDLMLLAGGKTPAMLTHDTAGTADERRLLTSAWRPRIRAR